MTNDKELCELAAQMLYLGDLEMVEYIRHKLTYKNTLWSERYIDRQNWLSNVLCRLVLRQIPLRINPRLTAARIVSAARVRYPGIAASKQIKQLILDVVFTAATRNITGDRN